jgi:hypothetical protein
VKHIDYAPFITLVSTVACLLSPLAGCTLDRWAEVEPGTYTVVHSAGRASAAAAREILHPRRQFAGRRLVHPAGPERLARRVPLKHQQYPYGGPGD